VIGLFVGSALVGRAAAHGARLSPELVRIATSFSRPIGWGALLALALDEPRGFFFLNRVLGQRWAAPLALLGTLAALTFMSVPGSVLDLSLTLWVGSCVVGEASGLCLLLTSRPARYIGRISYGLYLLHLTAIGVVRRAAPSLAGNALWVFSLALPLALLLASATYFAVERPLLGLRARFRPRAP
jgi:peptidoglycan/LPS O-acetylase OafA/YrhL